MHIRGRASVSQRRDGCARDDHEPLERHALQLVVRYSESELKRAFRGLSTPEVVLCSKHTAELDFSSLSSGLAKRDDAVMTDILAVMVYGWYRMVKDGE